MKVLTIIESLGRGGAERVLVNTLPYLKQLGVDCEVAILFKRDDLANELEEKGIRVHRLNLSNKWNIVEALVKMNQLVKANNYNIIHAHLFFAHFYTGLFSVFNKSFKSVVTFHNLGYNTFPANTLWRKLRKKLDSFIVNRLIDKKTAVSTAVKEHYAKHLCIQEIKVIFNSFPIKGILLQINENIEPLSFEDKYDFIAITPGRLVKEKGHQYLLEAIIILNELKYNVGYLIVGDGPLMNEIQSNINRKKIENAHLLGGVTHKRLLELIKISDLVISSSISEGFPMVIGEAMILGKPIVATNVGGTPDFIDNNISGLLVSNNDSLELANKVRFLLDNESFRKQIASNAIEKVQNFDISKVGPYWQNLYKSLLNEA